MKKLTGLAADQLKELVLEHLQGEDLAITTLRLEQQVARHQRKARDLFESVDVIEDDPFVSAILGSLNLDSEAKSHVLHKSSNLYELLDACNEPHLDVLLTCIDRSHPSAAKRTVLLGSAAAAALGGAWQQGVLAAALPSLKSAGLRLLSRLTALAGSFRIWPALAAATELAVLTFSLARARRLTPATLMVKSLAAFFTAAGFGFWATANVLTPLAAALLLASPLLRLTAAAMRLISLKTAASEPKNWEEQAALLRRQWTRSRLLSDLKREFIAGLATAGLLTAILTNPAFSLAGLAGLTVLPLLSALSRRHSQQAGLHALQDALRTMEYAPDAGLCPSTRPTALRLLSRQNAIEQQLATVQLREEQLLLREETMQQVLQALEKGLYEPKHRQNLSANEAVYEEEAPLLNEPQQVVRL